MSLGPNYLTQTIGVRKKVIGLNFREFQAVITEKTWQSSPTTECGGCRRGCFHPSVEDRERKLEESRATLAVKEQPQVTSLNHVDPHLQKNSLISKLASPARKEAFKV